MSHVTPSRSEPQWLKASSKEEIWRLSTYLTSLPVVDMSQYPSSKVAAVLVLLYEKDSQLRVLLTTRSKQLRTHAGQTALPGGRREEADANVVETAFREANEEVALPQDCPDIQVLGQLPPFISMHRLLVVPVVSFLSNPSILDALKPSEVEVARIFSHPLKAVLDPALAKGEPLVDIGSEDWPYETQLYSTSDSVVPMLGGTSYRMHRFRTSASPIKGLTADILIKVAQVAFGESTAFERFAPDQLRTSAEMIRAVMAFEKQLETQ